jgi:glucose-1-phosphate cytidylyltransferase
MRVTKAVILAGGYGTRLMEETESRPKPMVEIGGQPILWHIMKIFHAHGIREFIIPLGYKGHLIKRYFVDYHLHNADITVDLSDGTVSMHKASAEPWKVTLVDTGLETMTGGRLLRLQKYLNGESFCMTYGDGVTDLDIGRLLAFHATHGRVATVTAVRPPGRFGSLELQGTQVSHFSEKPPGDNLHVNGGFFVLSPKVFEYIADDATVFEREPMQRLAEDGELMAFAHDKFWYSMDTLRDRVHLEQLWASGAPPWKRW